MFSNVVMASQNGHVWDVEKFHHQGEVLWQEMDTTWSQCLEACRERGEVDLEFVSPLIVDGEVVHCNYEVDMVKGVQWNKNTDTERAIRLVEVKKIFDTGRADTALDGDRPKTQLKRIRNSN